MRANIYKIRCTGCKLEELILDGSNNYIFEGNKEREPALINYCFCYGCKKVNKLLEPFTLKNLNLTVDEFLSISRNNNSQKSFLNKFFKTAGQKSLEIKINLEKERLNFYQNNHYQSRCFNCSSFNIKKIDLPQVEGQKVLLNVTHDCGGQLNMSFNGFASLNGKSNIIFNVNGKTQTNASIEYCKTIANKAKIETILKDGLIDGFVVFIDENENLLKSHFKHESAQTSFIMNVEKRIKNNDFFDDREIFDRDLQIGYKESKDNYNSHRVIMNGSEIFYSWKASSKEH